MATSGILDTNIWVNPDTGSRSNLQFSWTATQSISGNSSTISWSLKAVRDVSGNVYAGAFKVVIDGDTVYKTTQSTEDRIKLYNGTIIATGTKTLKHNGDGTRSFDVYIEGGIYYYAPNCSGQKTFELNQIARASSITAVDTVVLGEKCYVRWTPMSESFRYKLKFAFDHWEATTDAIHPNTTSPYTYTGYTIPLEVAYHIPYDYRGTMSVTLYTYSDSGASEQVGDGSTTTFNFIVPASTGPDLEMVLRPVHSLPEAFDNIYVQGLSRVKAYFVATPKYNAEITSYDMTVDGSVYGEFNDYTSIYLTKAGTIPVVGHAKDSRTHDGYADGTIEVIPYANPKVQNVSVKRCDENGNLDDSGSYLRITATRNYQPVVSEGVQKNFCEIQYCYKAESAYSYSDWVSILHDDDLDSDTITTGALLNGTVDPGTTYRVLVRAVDTIGNTSSSETLVPTDKVYWHRDGARNSLGLGKICEHDNALDSWWDFYMNDHKITGLADPEGDTDAVNLGYLKEYIKNYIANLPKG